MDIKHIDKLNDVSSLVNDFCENSKGMSNFRLTGHAELGPLAHLQTLFQLKKANAFVKIFTNVTVAALHLGYVLETPFHGDLPDLPDAPDDYLSSLERYGHFIFLLPLSILIQYKIYRELYDATEFS
jgi:hypothetical protein